MRAKLTGMLLASLLCVIIPAIPVLAFITAPTSIDISHVNVFRNLVEEGDVLVLFHYNMPYTSDNYSTTPASESIMLRLVAENTTVTQTGAPYVYPFFESNGYGNGVGGFYMEAAEDFTWEQAARIDIIEQAAYFADPQVQSYTLTLSDYTTATTQEDNRSYGAQYILLECDTLASDYASTGVVLKTTSDVGVILSPYGESYFRGVVSGLQTIIPDLFFIQKAVPEQMAVTSYNMTLAEQYADRLVGDDLGEGFDNVPTLFKMNKYAFWGMFCVVMTIAAAVWTSRKNWGTEGGLALGFLLTVLISLLIGDVIFGAVMIASLGSVIGLVYLIFLKKA